MKKNKIDRKSISFFKKNGFLILRNVLNKKDLSLINSRLKFLSKKQKDGRGLSEPGVEKSLIHSLKNDKILHKIIEKKSWLIETSKKLLGCENIFCWDAKANLKKSWNGSVEYFHQDNIYREKLKFGRNMLNCMIFVDDHSHLNGGLWVLSGSHKKKHRHQAFLNINSLQKYFIPPKVLNLIHKKHKPVSINEKRGSCIFFHNLLVHGSSHNISSKDRKILLYGILSEKDYEKAR
jgi:Protein involved in biosynthesis of mitomycin antibiotics/polyketide fumonisin